MAARLFKNFKSAFSSKPRIFGTPYNWNDYDVAIVGGGIIGMATAREIQQRYPTFKTAVLEKEQKLAVHQTGHSCGVIHSGIYYKPGSMTARLCVEGLHLMYKYCDSKNIPYNKCGKLIVATDLVEAKHLISLHKRGIQNRAPNLKLINEIQIREIEPRCRGVAALWSPNTGSVDFALVTEKLGEDFKKAGGDMFLGFKVAKFSESNEVGAFEFPVVVHGSKENQRIRARYIVTCGGLQADFLAELTGCPREPRIVPFRGEYRLLDDKRKMIRTNIYAVPDPRSPALGIHFTPRMDGSVVLGPNVVVALSREGYKWSNINLYELFDTLRYRGFQRMVFRYLRVGLSELTKSAIPDSHLKIFKKYFPDIARNDVKRGPTGVRAQALDVQGNLLDNLIFHRGKGNGVLAKQVLHLRNMHWPGATSSLATAKVIVDKMEEELAIRKLEMEEKRVNI